MLPYLIGISYLLALSGLALYGWLGCVTFGLFRRHRRQSDPPPDVLPGELPPVTVQLPLYNERYVVERLVRSAVNLDYPPDRLQIQVLDDSTDDTTSRAEALVNDYRRSGVDISLIHRTHREGYKAGALREAARQARGKFIAIFDADFQPPADFLIRTIPYFLRSPQLGVVQARWTHLNDDVSLLTQAQAVALDKHFAVEQLVRHRANLFPKFNGTAGVWRRACLEHIGGWQLDTTCEDLCASTRAVLNGWQFRFLPDVVAPAELPDSISAYRSQQARWAKGSTECLLKYGRQILFNRGFSPGARAYALLTMASYATSLFLILLLLLQIPMLFLDVTFHAATIIPFSLAAVWQPLLFLVGQQRLHRDWKERAFRLPVLLLTAIGLSATISRAVLRALFRKHDEFVRTPKNGNGTGAGGERGTYVLPFDWILLTEVLFAAYAGAGIVLALSRNRLGPLFFLGSCCLGFTYVTYLSVKEKLQLLHNQTKINKINSRMNNL